MADVELIDADGTVRFRGTQSGGSLPLRVSYPFAFDTLDLATLGLPITAVDQGAKTFSVAGDQRAAFDRLFASGNGSFNLLGSTGNDSFYTPAAASVFAAGATTVEVTGAIPDPTVDGTIFALAGGVSFHTPVDGDTLILACVHVAEAFNGVADPVFRIFQENTDPTVDVLEFVLSTADVVPAVSLTPNAWTQVQPTNIQGEAAGDVLVLSAAAGPFTAILLDQSTFEPTGSTQGSGVLTLLIIPGS